MTFEELLPGEDKVIKTLNQKPDLTDAINATVIVEAHFITAEGKPCFSKTGQVLTGIN